MDRESVHLLSDMRALRAMVGTNKSPLRDKSVIFLFMHGGPSQFETFDPKMEVLSSIRSTTGAIATPISGVDRGRPSKSSPSSASAQGVVRSFVTGDGNHDIKPIVGKATMHANMGSLTASGHV